MILHGLVKKTTDENGSVWQGTYKFNKNGTYTRTNIEIDKQGNKKKPISTDNGHSVIQVSVPFILVENITGT